MSRRNPDLPVPQDHLLVGVVHRPHGVGGEVSVELIGENPERLAAGARLVAVDRHDGERRDLTISSSRLHRGRYLVHFAGVESRYEAESLRGVSLCIPESQARPKDDQVWIKDLYGLEVVNAEGRVLGKVVGVLNYPAQDVIEIETSSGKKLLPFVRDLVPRVDLSTGRIVVTPPEGIFEDGSG